MVSFDILSQTQDGTSICFQEKKFKPQTQAEIVLIELPPLHCPVVLACRFLAPREWSVPARHLDDVARLDAGRRHAHSDVALTERGQLLVKNR